MATHVGMCLWLFCIPIFLPLVSTSAQSDNYIIHMDLAAMPKAFSNQHTWYLATLSSVASSLNSEPSSVSSKLIYSYQNVMNGFSASLSPAELKALKSTPGYISSIPDLPVKHDTTHSPHFLGLNPVGGAWPVSKYGQDMIVGLVDTGIWPESQSFRDDGMSEIPSRWKGECESGAQFNSSLCNKKLIGARFFNKGLLALHPNITLGVNSTRDTEGHGTHTSTTAAGSGVEGASFFGYASGLASGMAPGARVAMYKALWEGGAYVSDIIAAIDSAIADGVDVLSLSFGLDEKPLYLDPIAIATFAAVEKGIFVSTSAGNRGPDLETLHNGIPWVITVAAATLDREFHGTLTLSDQVAVSGLSLYQRNFSAAQIPIVFMGLCDNMKKLIKVKSKIVVCEDNIYIEGALRNQVGNLSTAKVLGGVFISNNTREISYYSQFTPFPSIFLSPADGEIVKNFIKSSTEPKASMTFKITTLGTTPAPCVDRYSSRGPSQGCPFVLKPDVTAPGTLILAAWPHNVPVTELESQDLFFNDFNLLSGTSMSCPHVAGIAALIKEAHPDWSPAAIRSAIMTTSSMLDNTFGTIKDIGDDYKPATPLAVGAGHINPNGALQPGLVYDAGIDDYVNLLCALNYTQKDVRSITRSSFYNCSNPSLDLNYPSFIAFFNASDSTTTVKEFHRIVTHVGEVPATYVANITDIQGFHVSVTPDTLTFREKNQKLSYKLRIEGPTIMKAQVAFGHLIWSSMDLKYLVRSPIVVTSLNPQPILSHS